MAVVSRYKKPDFFYTVTTNPKWEAIQSQLRPGESTTDRPDIVARVFAAVLKEIKDDLFYRHVLGNIRAQMYVIEFQMRGLPHAHILIINTPEDSPKTPQDIDTCISAQLPAEGTLLYDYVKRHMIHGPCGAYDPSAKCMQNPKSPGKCDRGYPKAFRDTTEANVNGYPEYARFVRDSVHIT